MTPQAQTKVKIEQNGSLVVLRFEGDVTSASRDAVLGTYDKLTPETREILLDFSKVLYLNSSGIALVIQLLMEANKSERKVQTFGLTPHFQKVFTMLGLTKYTSLQPNESAAKASSLCHNPIMPSRASKNRPRDPNLLARSVVEDLIGETMEGKPLAPKKPEHEKNPAAVALSKLGASKGGKARAEKLSAAKRKAIAKKAAMKRWGETG